MANTPHPTPRLAGWPLWWRWTVATATGELLGFAVPAAVGALAVTGLAGLPTVPRALATLALVALAGVVEGAALGLAQWLVLRRALPPSAACAWALPTALAAGLAYILGFAPSTLDDLGAPTPAVIAAWVLVAVPLLLSIGLAQWTALRRYVPRAGQWVAANALGWLLGLPFTFAGIALVPDGSPIAAYIAAGAVSGWLMGAAVGAVTGLALVRLLRAGL